MKTWLSLLGILVLILAIGGLAFKNLSPGKGTEKQTLGLSKEITAESASTTDRFLGEKGELLPMSFDRVDLFCQFS